MTQFTGFQEGCAGQHQFGETPYVSAIAHFQKDGQKLDPADAGTVEPDAIRVVRVDDYRASTYRDRVFAFDSEAAQAQVDRADIHIPNGNISTLDDSVIEKLNGLCSPSCLANGGLCKVLEAAASGLLSRAGTSEA